MQLKRTINLLAVRWWATCRQRATVCSALSRRERRTCATASRPPLWQAWRRMARTRPRSCCTCRRAGSAGRPALQKLGHECHGEQRHFHFKHVVQQRRSWGSVA